MEVFKRYFLINWLRKNEIYGYSVYNGTSLQCSD